MKLLRDLGFVFGLTILSCNQIDAAHENTAGELKVSDESKDKREIQILIRQVLNWSSSEKTINLMPLLEDKKGKFCTGVDFVKHKRNQQKLKLSDLFAAEFINNSNQIVENIDKGMRNGRYEKSPVAELPSFNFASNVDPWSLCQDVSYDKPNPWNLIETETLRLNTVKGEFNWKWGKPELNNAPGWKEFRYRFRVVKENNKWKIAYLEGFNLKNSTAKKINNLREEGVLRKRRPLNQEHLRKPPFRIYPQC